MNVVRVALHPRGLAPHVGLPTWRAHLLRQLRVDGRVLRLYSTVATFGTPLDVAASELAIETFLPADEVTREWLERPPP